MVIELLLMSKAELYFGVCCFKDTETCAACHCPWFYFCAALAVVFAGFLPPPFTPLLTCSLESTDVVKHHNSSHGLCCWKCPPIPADPGGRVGKVLFLGGGAGSHCSGRQGSAEGCQPGAATQGLRWNCRPVFSTRGWYFRPVLLQLSRVDK